MLKIARITMDYQEEPVGTGGMPQFGWILQSDGRNVIQKAYHLQLAADRCFQGILYDTGWVESSLSAHVSVGQDCVRGGKQLESCTRYYVRVRVRTGSEESQYSDTASFVTGILKSDQWKAQFVTAEKEADKDKSGSTCLRKQIMIGDRVDTAYACITALGLYQFYINGKRVGEDELTPGWTSYHKHLCYQTYDVTEFVQEGENVLGAMLGAGWYKGKMGFLHLRNNYGTRTALCMQMTVRYRDGRTETFVTDSGWEGTAGPALFSEIYDGESYDAGLEIEDWCRNAGECVNGSGGSRPGESLWRRVETVDFPLEALTAQPAGRVRVMEQIAAKRVFMTPGGETVIDFGQNLTGWVHFRVRAKRGEEVFLKCFETLDAGGNVYTDNLRTARQEIHYRCKGGGVEEYHPHFTFMGFRYVQVLVYPQEVKREDFTAYVLYSRMEQTGTFECSEPLLNRLQHNILWSLKGNFVDIPTDCPQRDERMGWTGDAQIFCRTACYLMNTYAFFGKWLKDVAADQTKEGGVPHVVPDIISGKEKDDWLLSQGTHSAAAWADAAVIIPWTLYLVYGDKEILLEQYESMKRWIRFMRDHAQDDIWNYRLQFGDWVALDAKEGSYFGATPNELTCTAYYAYSTGLFAKIADVLGRKEDAQEYAGLYERIVEKFRRTFFREDAKMTIQTQTAHIIALYFQLVPEGFRKSVAGRLVSLLQKESGHLVTGFVGTPYFCHALSQNGYVKEAYDLLLQEDFPSWLYQVKMGATTIWEHWDGLKPDGTMWSPDMNSFNHYAYGAVGEWLYRVALGIEIDETDPGYHHVIISPQTGDRLAYARGSYESIYGSIRVSWERGECEGERRLSVTVPHNTTATIRLEEGAGDVTAGELVFAEKEGCMEACCGSGVWEILYRVHCF